MVIETENEQDISSTIAGRPTKLTDATAQLMDTYIHENRHATGLKCLNT